MAGDVAQLGAIVTLHDLPSIAAFTAQGANVEAHLKVDCGFGRLGLLESDWTDAFTNLQRAKNIRVVGFFTHIGQTEDRVAVEAQTTIFRRAIAMAKAFGFESLERMVASTRVAIGYPHFHLDAVNPVIGLYGLLEGQWLDRFRPRQVLRRLWTRVLQVKTLPAGARPGILGGHHCNAT